MGVWEAASLMVLSFVLLAKCADYLVEGPLILRATFTPHRY